MISQFKLKQRTFCSLVMIGAIFILLPITSNAAGAGLTYHGRLIDKDGHAVESSNVQFKLQIRTP